MGLLGAGAERPGEPPRPVPGEGGWFAFGVASQKADGFLWFHRFLPSTRAVLLK